MTERKKKSKKIYTYLLVFFILVFLGSVIFLIADWAPRLHAFNELTEIREKRPDVEDPFAIPSISALKEINPDIVGWIMIDETNIDHPLLQCSNNDYYLNHTYTEEYNDTGSIFLDYHNDADFADQNTVIYGHARLDGTMFAQLKKYKKQTGYDESPIITIILEGKIFYYHVFSANIVEASYDYRATSYEDFLGYIELMRDSSLIESSAVVKADSTIITLSTCTTEVEDGRLAVLAVLLNPDGEEIDLDEYIK